MTSGLFMNAVISDHFEGLRHLLNFAGMNSYAYVTGMLLAEYMIYLISGISVVLVGLVIGIEKFKMYWGEYILCTVIFGLPFITLTNVFSHLLSLMLASDP